MKTTEHVEYLLRQGKKPKELLALGFPKRVITRVRRRLREEKAVQQAKAPEGTAQAEPHVQSLPESPEKMAAVWQKLQFMANDLQRIDSLVKAVSGVTALMAAAQHLGTYRRETCPYQKDGLCTLHTWSSESDIPQGIGEPVHVGDEKPEWHIKPSTFYCAMCVIPFEDRLDDLENKLSGDPFSGARDQIICKSCGNKGWIAAKIMCTKCRRETYLGWWPEKE